MKMNERRVPRVSRMVSEWFREVPDDPELNLELDQSPNPNHGSPTSVQSDRVQSMSGPRFPYLSPSPSKSTLP